MQSIIIPKNFGRQEDLIVIPRREYEELLNKKDVEHKPGRKFKTFTLTADEKKILRQSREELKQGKYMTFDELKRKLATAD